MEKRDATQSFDKRARRTGAKRGKKINLEEKERWERG